MAAGKSNLGASRSHETVSIGPIGQFRSFGGVSDDLNNAFLVINHAVVLL